MSWRTDRLSILHLDCRGRSGSPEGDRGGGGMWWDEWDATEAEKRQEDRRSKRSRPPDPDSQSDPQWLSGLSLKVKV